MVRISPLLLLIGLTAEIPPAASDPLPYYDQKAQGWFWKERLPPPSPEPPHHPETIDPQKTEESAPLPLTAAWFRRELGPIRDQALDEPTETHVLRFFQLQKILLDKAERFARVARSIVLSHPELDERSHPKTLKEPGPGARRTPDSAPSMALMALGRQAGLLLVHRSDCPYCQRMAPLLEHTAKASRLRLYALSLDGPGLEGLLSATAIKDHSLAQRLGVEATPALFLMVPGRGFYPLGEGFMTEAELEDRLLALGETLNLLPRISETKPPPLPHNSSLAGGPRRMSVATKTGQP